MSISNVLSAVHTQSEAYQVTLQLANELPELLKHIS